MFAKFSKKSLFSKFISGIVAVSFIITSVPVRSYANSDKLRTRRADIGHQKNILILGDELKEANSAESLGELVNLAKFSGFDINLNRKTGKISLGKGIINEARWSRLLKDAGNSIADPSIIQKDPNREVYYGYRNVQQVADVVAVEKNGVRFDITVLLRGSIGEELIMTKGHNHPVSQEGDTFPEIYEVWHGKALYVQQGKNKQTGLFEVLVTVAEAGDKVVLLPDYSYRTVKISEEPLVMANWISLGVGGKKDASGKDIESSISVRPNFAEIEAKNGYSYQVVRTKDGQIGLRHNPKYGPTPAPLRMTLPAKSIPEIGLEAGVPMYNLIHNEASAKKLSQFLRLAKGQGFENVFNSAFKEISLAEAQNTHNLVVLKDANVSPIPAFVPAQPVSVRSYAARLEIMRNSILWGGNWKERKDIVDEAGARAKAREFKQKFAVKEGLKGAEIVLFPEAKWVKAVAEELAGTNITVGVQSLFFGDSSNPNNFTPVSLQEKINAAVAMGARYANVGHSMHRKSGEGLMDEQANKIMKAILQDGRLIPWYTIEISGKKDSNKEIADGINIGLSGITEEQVAAFPITPEPTALISTKKGEGKVETGIKIASADTAKLSRLVLKALETKYGHPVEVNVGYGASVKAENAREIFSNIEVRNTLIGGASLEAKDFFETVVNGMKGRPAQAEVVSIPSWVSELYYPAVVDAKHTEAIGDGYTKESLTYESKMGEFIHPKLKSIFKDEHKDSDVYVFLKKDGKIFALGKENKKDHTLSTVSTADLSDIRVKTEYYSMLFEFVSKITEKTGEFIELVEQDGERLKRFISRGSKDDKDLSLEPAVEEEFSLGDRIKGIKYWFGDQPNLSKKFFQMEFRSKNASLESRPTLITFKPSPRLNGGGLSLIVQPKENVLVNGAGTVGYRDADAMRKSGFFVKGITVGNLNSKARDASWRKGYTLYYYKTDKSESFDKEKIKVVGTLNEILESKTVDIVIDGSEDGKGNKKIYDKQIEKGNIKGVIFQGGEDADIAPVSYSSSTNHAQALGAQYVRVVSCNTTGLARTFGQITETFENVDTTAVLDRRMKDPKPGKGDLDTVIAEKGASHHAADVLTVLPDEWKKHIKTFRTLAVKVPTTHFHMHVIPITATGLTAEKVTELLKKQSRVGMIDFKKEIDELALYEIYQEYLKINDSFLVAAIVSPLTDEDTQGNVKIIENGAVLHLLVDQQSIVVPETPNAAQAMRGISKDASAAIRIVDEAMGIDEIKRGLEKIAPAKLEKKPSTPKAEVKLPIDVLTESDVTVTGTVGVREDSNSSKNASGEILMGSKLANAARAYNRAAKKGNKVVAISHQGRKKDGQPDKDYTEDLIEHSRIISKLLNKEIGYVPDLFGDLALSEILKMKSGEILQLKNARSWETETDEGMSPEAHSQTPLIQNLSKVLDIIEFSNLAILHRYNVTIDGWPIDMPIILGDKVIKDIANIENARQILIKSQPCLFMAGGAKIDDYLVLIDKGLENNMFTKVQTGGLLGELCLLAQGYKLGKPTMKILEKQFKKFESENGYGAGLEAMVKEVQHLLEKHAGKIDVPIDVAFINQNGQRQVVAVEEKHKTEAITDEYEIRDIGDATANKYAQDIKNAKGVLIKGPLGDVANEKTAVGTLISYSAIVDKQEKDPEFTSMLGGGDAGTAFDQLKLRKDKFSVVVDAGGALIVYLAEGANGLPGLVAAQKSAKYYNDLAQEQGITVQELLAKTILAKQSSRLMHIPAEGSVDLPSTIQNIINQIKAKYNIPEVDIRKFFATVQLIHNAWGGPQFGNFVDTLAKTQQPAQEVSGELKISAEKKFKENGEIVASIVLEAGNVKLEKDVWTGTLHSSVGAIDKSKEEQEFYVSEINGKITDILKERRFDISKKQDFYDLRGKIEKAYEDLRPIPIVDIINTGLYNLRNRLLANRHVIIVSPAFFKLLDAIPTLLKAIELAGDNFQFVLYGKGADNFRDLLGGTENKNIIVADTLTGVISELDALPGNILALVSSAEAKEDTGTLVKKLVFSQYSLSTDVLAMGITTVLNNDAANNAGEAFYKAITDVNKGIVAPEASAVVVKHRREVKSQLSQVASIELPFIPLAPETKSVVTAAETSVISEFIAKMG